MAHPVLKKLFSGVKIPEYHLQGRFFEKMVNIDKGLGGFGDTRLGVSDHKQRDERIIEQGSNRFIRVRGRSAFEHTNFASQKR